MKLPDKRAIVEIVKVNCETVNYATGRCELYYEKFVNIADDIIARIKIDQFDEDSENVDSKLVKIAELEAKIKVYETVIEGAGIKLAMPKENKKKNE